MQGYGQLVMFVALYHNHGQRSSYMGYDHDDEGKINACRFQNLTHIRYNCNCEYVSLISSDSLQKSRVSQLNG